jgi:two-component system chemotaxis response regulator CheB
MLDAQPPLQPEAPIRVLVVDDSVVVRRIIARALEGQPGLELAGVAPNGRVALAKVVLLRPDVVVLDLEMPEMNGFETLAEIRRSSPGLPVIVFSRLSEGAAAATLDALERGATDFLPKPTSASGALGEEYVRFELLPRIRALVPRSAPGLNRRRPPPAPRPRALARVGAVVVGVSTGGPDALATIVGKLQSPLPVPVLIVQHMPPVFTRLLAERLDRLGPATVVEASPGEAVVPGLVYLAPGGHHLLLTRVARDQVLVRLDDGPPENSCRPAADALFRSAADVYGPGTLAVVLTGMGRDGLRGAELVRSAGGSVIAQDVGSCVVGSMPGAVAGAGLADAVVPLDEMASVLVQRVGGTD